MFFANFRCLTAHAIDIVIHFFGADPQHIEPEFGHVVIADSIILVLFVSRMGEISIDFNRQSRLPGIEIDDKWTNGMLTTELQPGLFPRQVFP